MDEFKFESSVLQVTDFTGIVVELTADETGATLHVMRSEGFSAEQAQGLLQLASDNMVMAGMMYTGEMEVNND